MNIHAVNVIARYEVKLLKRSWLFRIFAVLALFILTIAQLSNFTPLFWKDVYKRQVPLFLDNLKKIRYRNGKIEGYTSRLHYSSDWLYEMQRQGFLEDVTRECGGIHFPIDVFFMTKNACRYPAFEKDSLLIFQMEQIETCLLYTSH